MNTIYHADAMDLLACLPDESVDLVLTDPPYGLAGRVFKVKNFTAVNEYWDHEVPTAWMSEAQRVLKPNGSIVCFGGRQSIYITAAEGFRLGWRLVNDITWYKPDAPPNFTGRMMTESTERALWFCPDGKKWTYNKAYAQEVNGGVNFRDVWHFTTVRNNRVHPTQKPLELIVRLVKLLSNQGDIVLDPFMGSGTTAIAALLCGRQFIGSEQDKRYHEIGLRRIQAADHTKETIHEDGSVQLSLFAEQAS